MEGNKGANYLARVINAAATNVVNQRTQSPVLGRIQSDMGLLLDDFPIKIPRSDYLVSEHLTLASDYFTDTNVRDGVRYRVQTPSQLSPLSPGDRVLCIPVNQGRDYVVIGRVR